MKHGRRHKTLKEQAYIARKDAEGYATPYRPIDVAQPAPRKDAPPESSDSVPLAARLNTRAKKALRWKGVEVDEEEE